MLSDHITVTSSVTPTPPAPSQRQRVTCFVGVHTVIADVAKAYTSLEEMEDDGWDDGDPIYNMVSAMLDQKPVGQQPTKWFVGKRATPVAAAWTVDVVATADGAMTLTDSNGVVVASFTASGNTATQIKDGLIASAHADYTLASVDADTLTVTKDEAGVPMTLTIGGAAAANLTATQTTAGTGIFADLDDIQAEIIDGQTVGKQVWHYEVAPALGPYGLTELARWTHADGVHTGGSQSSDANIPDDGSSADGPSLIQALAYSRTNVTYRALDTDYVAAMVLGHVLPAPAGSVNYAWRPLTGSVLATLTSSANVATFRSKRSSWAELIDEDGEVKYFGGRDANGTPMYHWSAIDNWYDNVRAKLVFMMTAYDAIDFTDEGIDATLVAGLRETMDIMVAAGTLMPEYTITAVPVADVPDGEIQEGDYQTTGAINIEATLRTFVDRVTVAGTFSIAS